MLGVLLLAATGGMMELPAAPSAPPTQAVAEQGDPDSRVTFSLRLGPTFGGVYNLPYGGQNPYGAGGRFDLTLQAGAGRFRFHALLTGSWSPFLKNTFGYALPSAGEVAGFAGAGFHEDTNPTGRSAFVLECDTLLGVSRLWDSYNGADGKNAFFPYATFYPLDFHVAFGMRFAGEWEVLFSQDLAFGGVWEESKVDSTVARESLGVLLGRSF
jgi:hypothetical protein